MSRTKRDYTRACFPASPASPASLGSRRRVDLSWVGVSVNQPVGATLYATHTYVGLFWYRWFCADDLDETLFGGFEEHNGDAVHAHLGGDAAQRCGLRALCHVIRASILLTVVLLELGQSVLQVRELGDGHHVRKDGP